MALTQYRRKRKFTETPEPKGSVRAPAARKLRFVVHKHEASRLHYDLRLEKNGVLKSWAVPKGPSMDPADRRLAVQVEDHPLDYISFRGTIPEGNYGAGRVVIWDRGTYEPVVWKPDHYSFILHGKKLKGEFALIHTKRPEENSWLLLKAHDKAEAAAPMPHAIKPMLALAAEKPFDREGWIFEIKWDGYRAIAEIRDGKVRLYSRNLIGFNERYPAIVDTLKKLPGRMILDGEIVALDRQGKPQFQLLQDSRKTGAGALVYYVFDMLYLNGRDLRGLPLRERKKILKDTLPKLPNVKYNDHVEEKGSAFFRAALAEGLEGMIAKDASSAYEEGTRSGRWIKIKAHLRQEAVIAGFTDPRGSREDFGALVLGVYKNGELTYIGHTGGGFDRKMLAEVYAKLRPLEQRSPPFRDPPKTNAPVHWVRPKLVCEVSFQEWTSDGVMRQPIFMGLREDKQPKEVSREAPVVKVKNPGKVFWPEEGYTKGDVIEYYRKISGYIVPYLKDRPESLNRHPNGITGGSFYHKDMAGLAPAWIPTIKIRSEHEKKVVEYLICQDERTLVYMANLGCIEINPWASRTGSLDNPDYAVFDLDPEHADFRNVVKTALVIRNILKDAGAESFCKTSGSRGLHLFIPLGARYSYQQARDFAELIAGIANAKLPEITSVVRSPGKRRKKVYIDYLQNGKGKTMAAAYSLRPKPGAPVSTPLKWTEVKAGLDPAKFTIKTIFRRLQRTGDLWKPVLGKGIDLDKVLRRLQKKFS